MSRLPPEEFKRQGISGQRRWQAMVATGRPAKSFAGAKSPVLRQPRLLVPIDVQALYVPPDGGEPMARLPFNLRTDAEAATGRFETGSPRPPGVHLHWAMPDALARGRRAADGSPEFPALANRWVVLRLVAPAGSVTVDVRGWVVEADAARVVALEAWPHGPAGDAHGLALFPAELTAGAGGSLLWSGCYDASYGRFAVHDPLDDLAGMAAPADSSATYVVAGWWSDPRLDPLDRVRTTTTALDDRLDELGWTLVPGDGEAAAEDDDRSTEAETWKLLGVSLATRYGTDEGDSSPTISASALADGMEGVQAGVPILSATLLHGMVLGVPVAGPVSADRRPSPAALQAALGVHLDDVAGGFAAEGLSDGDADRRQLERVLAAFTGSLLARADGPDGAAEVDQFEHEAGFAARSMGTDGVDHLRRDAGGAGVAAGSRARTRARSAAGVGKVAADEEGDGLLVVATGETILAEGDTPFVLDQFREIASAADEPTSPTAVAAVERSAARVHSALDPQVAVRGAAPTRRHGGDGFASPDGLLRCRWPHQVVRGWETLVTGKQILPALPTSALPDEVLRLAREAVLISPYLAGWLAGVAAAWRSATVDAAATRFMGEALLRFGPWAAYGAGVASLASRGKVPSPAVVNRPEYQFFEEQLNRPSFLDGVAPDPVAVTCWAQPWVPLVADWEAEVVTGDRLDGWVLGNVDLDPDGNPAPFRRRLIRGRGLVTTGAARRLAGAVEDFLRVEDALDKADRGEVGEADEDRLAELAAVLRDLDLVSITLQGLRQRLLGLTAPVNGGGAPELNDWPALPGLVEGPADGELVSSGTLTLRRLRLVDAFGRGLDVPVAAVTVPERERSAPSVLRLRPRLNVDARWRLRFTDPAASTADPAEATVDQRPGTTGVNPVSGFLLPDHIDEALELFDAAGSPLGQLFHEPVGGGVAWEIAPGRGGRPDAGPTLGVEGAGALMERLAAGLLAADTAARGGDKLAAGAESALSALLRAIDTTLWTVDPLAAMGTEHIAGLVGRPMAVVTATLRLELEPDPRQVRLDDPVVAAAWDELVRGNADRAFPVRLGALTRTDDGLLAYFVDGDYSRVRLVDKAVAGAAVESGRNHGYQRLYGTAPPFPAPLALDHPYVVADDTVLVRPGQIVHLTLLLHPGGRVHLTSGVLPRKAIALARDWVAPGLAVMAPSVRVGPVLLDPAKVRLPRVSSLGAGQGFTRRDTPGSWKDDPILAATQSALLPELPHEIQEGYIRILPDAAAGPGGPR